MKQLFFVSVLLSSLLFIGMPHVLSKEQDHTNSDQAIKLGVELVVLDAQVLNKRTGRAIGGLSREHFTIYEDGIQQQISHFSQDALPLSILILIDTSSSVWPYISQIRKGALQALEHLKPDDEVAVMATAASTELVQNFTKNKLLVAERIKNLDKKALGNDGILLHEAIYQAATHFRRASNPHYRRAIIAITDDVSTQRLASQGHSEQEAFDELYELGIAVSALLVGNYALKKRIEDFYRTKWDDPIGTIVKKATRMKSPLGPGSIQDYVTDTGGIFIAVEKRDVSAKLTEIIIQLRSRYSLGYVPLNTTVDGKFRKIKLIVSDVIEKREGGLAIVTRKGYYARVPVSAK